ncbi:restriction endonuclease subunit S [Actinophytocola algeriensis]|uniref:Type I restriction enzyme S subunit n=1 Tax=Actinophytocola algeriensis TaxID=1768010 RepID=A0A7W7Q5A2_9PSEU|nr:restriction endonuclease subunit S [Actinophytocola algeriensis]MBB4907073.1 type I restriction enzyme S subunit [Actinophytocola algeriensis]MBE1478556.1 type I restriction enzyme S subunit [Actinophytocola algeriensis]
MQSYAEMTTANSPWLDEVPAHWDLSRFRYEAVINGGQVDPREEPWSGMTLIAPNHIESNTGRIVSVETADEQGADSGKYLVKQGQIVYSKIRPALNKAVIAETQALCSADMYAMSFSDRVEPRFALYYLLARPFHTFATIISTRVKMPKVNREELADAPWLVPPLDEQRAIADYLDRETARIDTLIEEQQRLIEMLRERRRVLATRAVCFGVDEDVELRDSGDPVVGLVPRHWTVKAVRYWLESLDGRRIPLSGEERADRRGDFDYYGASGVIDRVNDYLFDEPLVLVSEDGANLLMRSTPIAFAAKGRYWVNNHAHVLRPLSDGDVDFWAQRLEALDVTTVVSGAAQPKLTAGALMGLRVSAPDDVDEQRRIAAYLAKQTSKIDTLITESELFVELSRERRAALITAAVTGQIDVREML